MSVTERPWMTALETKFAVLRTSKRIASTVDAPKDLQFAADGAVKLLPASETYAWSRETATAAMVAARSMPGSATLLLNDLPSRASWWWFEQPLPIALPDADTPDRIGREIGALIIGPTDTGRIAIVVHRFARHESGVEVLMPTSVYAVVPGTRLDQVYQDIPTDGDADERFRARRAYEVTRFVIAACAWLRQRVVSIGLGHIERHTRRRLEREHNVPIPSTVKVIELRRYETQSHEPRPEDSEPVEWSCRWIVNGHWRNQPYKDERKLIYILPFVKGPADKPLRVPTHTVYQVDR